MSALAWAKLLRVSLFASAIADPIVGVFLGRAVAESVPLGYPALLKVLLITAVSSLSVYHGAMALNDWADRKTDRQNGRGRPLELGLVNAHAVLLLAIVMLAGGPALAWFAGLGLQATVAIGAAAIVAGLYDLVGRGPWLGPILLGLARALNLCFGALAMGWDGAEIWGIWKRLGEQPTPELAPLFAALLYALFVFYIGRLGRMEDGEDTEPLGDRPTKYLRHLAGDLLVMPLFVGAFVVHKTGLPLEQPYLLIGVPVGFYLAFGRFRLLNRLAKLSADEHWTPKRVEAVMGPVLGSLVPMGIATLLIAVHQPAAWVAAAFLFAAQQLSRRLMRFIPPS